jgi:hypothetical protein
VVIIEISVSLLYKATENKLQGPGMTVSKYDQGPQSNWFRNKRLPSDFNDEVEGDVEVVKYFS